MSINWNEFTPWSSLLGGALIGLAASALVLFNGKIAGISGIIGGLFRPVRTDICWRLLFVLGIVSAPIAYALFMPLPAVQINASTLALITAGLLVGIGTRYGSGCTSGHGVCGLSRLSFRSLLATLSFMGAGFATVFVTRHLLSL